MARIETDPNYSAPTFSRATAATDLFKKEDVQALAAALSTHDHTVGKGVPPPTGSITTTMLADSAVTTAKIALNAVIASYAVTATTINPQTTSTTLVDMPDMVADISTIAGSTLFIWGITSMNSNNLLGTMRMAISYDGTVIGPSPIEATAAGVGYSFPVASFAQVVGVTAGVHQIRLRWSTSASNTITAVSTQRSLMIVEYKR